MNVKSLFEESNLTTEPSSPVRGSFGTFPVKSTEECEAGIFAKTPYEAENKTRRKKKATVFAKTPNKQKNKKKKNKKK